MLAIRDMPGTLLVASYFGSIKVVEHLPQEALINIDVKNSRHGRSTFSWTSWTGHAAVLHISTITVKEKDFSRHPQFSNSRLARILAVDEKSPSRINNPSAPGNSPQANWGYKVKLSMLFPPWSQGWSFLV